MAAPSGGFSGESAVLNLKTNSVEKKREEEVREEDCGDAASEVEPGACAESMLLTTDSYEEIESQLESSLDEENRSGSLDSLVQTAGHFASQAAEATDTHEAARNTDQEEEKKKITRKLSELRLSPRRDSRQAAEADSPESSPEPEEEFLNNPQWREKKKHVFILSEAGKPIYSRYGSEDKLVTIFGLMQALVSFVQDSQDVIRCIKAGPIKFVFLVKGPIILVSVCRTMETVPQIVLQLTYVYNQIVSVLTLTQLHQIYSKRRNYDLRRLLSGSERLLDHLLTFMEREPAFLLGAIKCLPLGSSVRDTITQSIINCCSKIKNLVFAILLAENQLVTLVRIKKFCLHPADLHLLFNLVNSSESFKSAESWTPICLPKFDHNGFLHSHVSYLSEDCQACLLLLTVERDIFFTLSEAKQKIVERLRRHNCLEAINTSVQTKGYSASQVGIGDLRHFLYKSKSTAQYTSPEIEAPYCSQEEKERLFGLYLYLHHRIHSTSRPLKLLFHVESKETLLGWVTSGFELYVVFEPLVTKISAINGVNKLLRWIKKEEDRLFILNAPTF